MSSPCFNSRPRGAGDSAAGISAPPIRRFNSRPRGAGDFNRILTYLDNTFQFTPARGGRRLIEDMSRILGVSIHARAGRATSSPSITQTSIGCFNSRPRGAGDLKLAGAYQRASFNSRPRGAGDTSCSAHTSCAKRFQFTPARGGRLVRRRAFLKLRRFNSRPRGAGD